MDLYRIEINCPKYFMHIVMSHLSHPMLSTNQLIYSWTTAVVRDLLHTYFFLFILYLLALFFMSHCFDTHQHYSSGKKISDLLPSAIFHQQILNQYINSQRCQNRGEAGGYYPPQFLADQLTLFQPGGAKLCLPHYYRPPRFLDGAASLLFVHPKCKLQN